MPDNTIIDMKKFRERFLEDSLERLREAYFRGNLVIFVGAGVDKESNYPLWDEAMEPFIEKLYGNQLTDTEKNKLDKLKIPQYYYNTRGNKEYADLCKEIFCYNQPKPISELHKKIIDLSKVNIRTGRGSNVVDNSHYDGVYAAVDVNTGIICSLGYNLLGEKFVKHPDSYVVFAGFQIPKWQELLKLAKNIASINHNLRYIGWDFVLTPNYEWLLLEGNEPGGIHIHQQPLNKGLYNEYKSLICG